MSGGTLLKRHALAATFDPVADVQCGFLMPTSKVKASVSASSIVAAPVSRMTGEGERPSTGLRTRETISMQLAARLLTDRWIMLLPAVFTGAAIMWARNAPFSDWGVHLLTVAMASCVCVVVSRVPWLTVEPHVMPVLFLAAIVIAAVAAHGPPHVVLWYGDEPTALQLLPLVCPIVVIASASLMSRSPGAAQVALLIVQGSHVIQADASQASALGVGVLTLVSAIRQPFRLHWLVLHALLVSAAWLRYDPISPRSFVADIVLHAFRLGPSVAIAAIGSLVLAVCSPLPLVISPNQGLPAQAALFLYFATTVLVSMFGEFPVPWLGLSPCAIVGSAIAPGLLTTWMAPSLAPQRE